MTWTLLTGKLLYKEKQLGDASVDELEQYEVFRADADDITYTRDFYNFQDRSITLLQSRTSLSKMVLDQNQENYEAHQRRIQK